MRLDEHVVDRLKHPKYGVLTWEVIFGKNIIYRNSDNKVIGLPPDRKVSDVWAVLKKQAQTANQQAGGVPAFQESEEMDMGGDDEMMERSPRDVSKPEGPDASWISSFDVKEVHKAIESIVEYLPSVTEDSEQTNLLRNDIRVLDNLASAMKSKKSEEIARCWKVCTQQGSSEHLHDEFCQKMAECFGNVVAESMTFKQFLGIGEVVFETYQKWEKECTRAKATIKEADGFAFAYDSSDEMIGTWTKNGGWVYKPSF